MFYIKTTIIIKKYKSQKFNFFQGSEMVVAGLLTGIQNDAPVLEYEIMATQALGDFKIDGKYNTSQVLLLSFWEGRLRE